MSGWTLFIVLFLIALIFWVSVWKIITWGYDKLVTIFTNKREYR